MKELWKTIYALVEEDAQAYSTRKSSPCLTYVGTNKLGPSSSEPFWIASLYIFKLRESKKKSIGLSPKKFLSNGFAPLANNTLTISRSGQAAAWCKHVQPLLSMRFRSLTRFTNNWSIHFLWKHVGRFWWKAKVRPGSTSWKIRGTPDARLGSDF